MMRIAYRLVTPTLAVLVLLLTIVAAVSTLGMYRSIQVEENRYLLNQSAAFHQELQNKTHMALALAKQIASNPEISLAFARQHRSRLSELTLSAFQGIRPLFHVSQEQFVIQPATVFLRLHDISSQGDSLVNYRTMLVEANATNNDISGIEIAEDGLGARGVAGVKTGSFQGVVDIGLRIDQTTIQDMKNQFGGEWQLSLVKHAMQSANYPFANALSIGPAPELALVASTRQPALLAAADTYRQVLDGETIISRIPADNTEYSVISFPILDYSRQVVGIVDVLQDRSAILERLRRRSLLAVGVSVLGLIIAGLIINTIIVKKLTPINDLSRLAYSLAEGDLETPLPPILEKHLKNPQPDELDHLIRNFPRIGTRLRRTLKNLEEQTTKDNRNIEQRTLQLNAIADITRDVATSADVQSILEQVVQVIRQRFNYHHAGVFLNDESGDWATLRAAAGDASRKMLEEGYRLPIDRTSLVGNALSSGQVSMVQDTSQAQAEYSHPYLPNTRSQAALPLRLGSSVMGALDIHSTELNAFGEGDIAILQILADQVAIAVHNAQLSQEISRRKQELEAAYSNVTRQVWTTYMRQQDQTPGYRYVSQPNQQNAVTETNWARLQPIGKDDLSDPARRALSSSQTVVIRGGPQQGGALAAVPILLRGHAIGIINLNFDTPNVSQELLDLVEEMGVRLGLVLESARLLQEAQRLAAREQQINAIATQMRSSVDLEAILQNTVRELGKVLGAKRTFIQLGQAPIPALEAAGQPLANQPPPGQTGAQGLPTDEVQHE